MNAPSPLDSRTRAARPAATSVRARIITARPWEDEIERQWRNASDEGPGIWRAGLWLGQGLLASLFARRPWKFQSMASED